MRRWVPGLLGLAAAAATALFLTRPATRGPAKDVRRAAAPTALRDAKASVAPTLYCEFYDFASRIPKAGFCFANEDTEARPAFGQIDPCEMDGSRTEFGGVGEARPAWAFDGSDDPAILKSPDGAIGINLYAYRRTPGTTWFEAGLRSVRYLNLDGKCRLSAA